MDIVQAAERAAMSAESTDRMTDDWGIERVNSSAVKVADWQESRTAYRSGAETTEIKTTEIETADARVALMAWA